jgi:hypothetical protein
MHSTETQVATTLCPHTALMPKMKVIMGPKETVMCPALLSEETDDPVAVVALPEVLEVRGGRINSVSSALMISHPPAWGY